MSFDPDEQLTLKQHEAIGILTSPARYALLEGGSGSGKTFLICRHVAIRACKAPGSRHLMARLRFRHIKTSIWHNTFPTMMRLCFPGVAYEAKAQDFYYLFPNGSEIWIGGLDDKERTEKMLGNEYATIFCNEISELTAFATIEKLVTRLRQNAIVTDPRAPDLGRPLTQKMIFDCNPPLKTHWAYRLFHEHRSPEAPFDPLRDPENYRWLRLNPEDNQRNLSPEYLDSLQHLSARQRLRFWAGEWGSANENALWTPELIERSRVQKAPELLTRVIVAVDPSGTKDPAEDNRSDAVGIVVVGLGADGLAYVLEDLTLNARPALWGAAVVDAYQRHEADRIVAETNFGGAMVGEVIRSAAKEKRVRVNFGEVTASRGKVVRAEPISTLYGDFTTGAPSKVRHVGNFPELEDQLCAFTTMGYMGDRSPDRADALIWALSELFPGMTRKAPKSGLIVEGVSNYNPLRY